MESHSCCILVMESWLIILLCLFLVRGEVQQEQPLFLQDLNCRSEVPRITNGEYYYHDNDTYNLRVVTRIEVKLDLHHRSCFQVDIDRISNDSDDKISSLLYVIDFKEFRQHYAVRSSYTFGIPELRSYCKCDCPKADAFCTHNFGRKLCSKGEICVTKFQHYEDSIGCAEEGPASLCCEVSVTPYEDRRYHAISLSEPTPSATIVFEIYVKYRGRWMLFRNYQRQIAPYKGNMLHLNGYENVADITLFAEASPSLYKLKTDIYNYYYEDNADFTLIRSPNINDLYNFDVNKFGWLRYVDNQWYIENPLLTLHDIHRPLVRNCKEQTYTDQYSGENVRVIRNSTGAVTVPFYGYNARNDSPLNFHTIELATFGPGQQEVVVTHTASGTPTLSVDMGIQQKITVMVHVHASFLEGFVAKICLDQHLNRYLNITLMHAQGEFVSEIYRDNNDQDVDLVLSIVTNVPFASNYTEILPLPTFIATPRTVCVHPTKNQAARRCSRAAFEKTPVAGFELRKTFIESAGSCPGCNLDVDSSSTFWGYLNPRKWLNGIGSFHEGLAMGVEVFFYILLLIFGLILWRRLCWPLFRWAICSCRKSEKNMQI